MSGINGNGRSNVNGKARTILWDTDPDVRRVIIRALKAAATMGEAARAAGIGRRTLYQWRDEHAHVAQALTHARAKGRERRLRIINFHARRDWKAAAHLLAIENPGRYSVKQRVEHSTPSQPMGKELSDDEAREALDRLGETLDSASTQPKPGSHSRLPE